MTDNQSQRELNAWIHEIRKKHHDSRWKQPSDVFELIAAIISI